MKKNSINQNSLQKQAYVKPEMEVMDMDMGTNLLTESPNTINDQLNDEVVIENPNFII